MSSRRLLELTALCLLACGVLVSSASSQEACPNPKHNCTTQGGPGCSDQACCAAVCALDFFCCNVVWDGACVNLAVATCGAPPCELPCPPGAIQENEPCGADLNGGCNIPVIGDSSCCREQPGPGCDTFSCELAVCAVEPFCCSLQWDGFCAFLALGLCPDVCALGKPAFMPIACGQTICGTTWAEDNNRDTDWFQATLESTTEVTFTVTSGIDLRIGIVNNGGVPDCSLSTALSPLASTGICGTASVTACLVPGTYWLYLAPNAFGGFPCGGTLNGYVASLTCGGPCVPPSCGSTSTGRCFEPSGAPFCDDLRCCETVCAIDPYCCDIAWDEVCVSTAKIYCVTCTLPTTKGEILELEPCGASTNNGCNEPILGSSSCCSGNSTPGCDDPLCAAAVCEFEPFCCEVVWDAACATFTPIFCPELCQLGSIGFEPIACGQTIRGTAWADGGIKDTDWYEITVTQITPITVTATAQFPLLMGVSDTGGFGGCLPNTGASQLNPLVLANPCVEASFTTCLEPGTWYIFVAPSDTSNWPCTDAGCDCPDLNGSGTVDAVDLSLLLGAWGTADPCANLDGSGTVGAADLSILLGAWGPYRCPAESNGYVVSLACGGACTGPPNDFCQQATPIGLGATPFSTDGATSGGPLLPAACDEGADLIFVRDIWFTYTPTETGVLTVSTCNAASFDTRLAAYTGPCGNLQLVGCNDDAPNCFELTSEMQFLVLEGETYRIRLGSYAFNGGGVLTLTLE